MNTSTRGIGEVVDVGPARLIGRLCWEQEQDVGWSWIFPVVYSIH